MILHLRAAVEQLYAAVPAEFTASRTELVAQARAAGEKGLAAAISKLRKPTVAAWAVNHFVRVHHDELDELTTFAELLREAQRTLDADQLRALGRERARRVDALTDRVVEVAEAAGHPLGVNAAQEVRDTLVALVADEVAQASVLTGALVRSLSYSGFGSVDIDDVVAVDELRDAADLKASSTARPDLEVLPGGGETIDLDARREERRTAERAKLVTRLEAARSDLRASERQVAVLTARQEEVVEGIADLERRLDAARSRLDKVTGELGHASRRRDEHEGAETRAQQALDRHDEGR